MASDTILDRPQSVLSVGFSVAGVFDLMETDKALVAYTQLSTDTNTIKTLLTAIANATLTPFTHCKNYTITYDSEDSLISTYIPADDFQVAFGESRLSAFKKLISKTNCKAIIKADGAIHVSNPTVSGTTYAYQYNDAATNHNFFEKGTRKRLVIPTKRIVSSHPGASPSYTGSATDTASETALGRSLPDPTYIRAVSDAQCTAVAGALLQNDQVAAELGHGVVPMNCGQEVMDYVKITDSIAADTRTGNVSYIRRQYVPGKKFKCEIRFGKVSVGLPFLSAIGEDGDPGWQAFNDLIDYIDEKDQMILQWFLDGNWGTLTLDEIINGETYSRLLSTQISAGKIYLSSANVFDTEYNPSSKRRVFNTTPTTPYVIGDLWFDASVIKRCTTTRASGDYVAGDWTAVTLDELANGSTYVKVLATDISAGHIKLTSSTVIEGEWYDKSGVEIDADSGINIYGTANALTTRATKTGTIQCYVGADGFLYAGAGRVSLGAGGIIINRPDATLTQDLIFKYAGAAVGYIYPISTGVAILGNIDLAIGNASGGGIEIFAGSLVAPEANTLKLRAVASASLASGSVDPTPAGNDIWIDSDDDIWMYADADISLNADDDVLINATDGIAISPGTDLSAKKLMTANSDVTASRALGTVYQNAGDYPLLVTVSVALAAGSWVTAAVELIDVTPDVIVAQGTNANLSTISIALTFVVPIGAYYEVSQFAGTVTKLTWTECTIGG